jgi:hypothetical protein
MAEHDETQDDRDVQRGVFGNLPSTRPAVRSPRRGAAKNPAGAGAAAEVAGKRSQPAGQPKRSVPRPPRRPPPARPPAAEPETPAAGAEHGSVEELAWAGIAVAAEAATLGVRLLSRAVEAVRKPADRG